jgi:hypothetical protein
MAVRPLPPGLRDLGRHNEPIIGIDKGRGDEEWVLADRLNVFFGRVIAVKRGDRTRVGRRLTEQLQLGLIYQRSTTGFRHPRHCVERCNFGTKQPT